VGARVLHLQVRDHHRGRSPSGSQDQVHAMKAEREKCRPEGKVGRRPSPRRGGSVPGYLSRERSAGPAAVPNFRHLQPVIVTSGCEYGGQSIQARALPPLSILSCSQLTCSHWETRPIQRQLPFPAHGNRLHLTANGKHCRQSRNEVTDKQTVSSMW
jgi:hypothetical protein